MSLLALVNHCLWLLFLLCCLGEQDPCPNPPDVGHDFIVARLPHAHALVLLSPNTNSDLLSFVPIFDLQRSAHREEELEKNHHAPLPVVLITWGPTATGVAGGKAHVNSARFYRPLGPSWTCASKRTDRRLGENRS